MPRPVLGFEDENAEGGHRKMVDLSCWEISPGRVLDDERPFVQVVVVATQPIERSAQFGLGLPLAGRACRISTRDGRLRPWPFDRAGVLPLVFIEIERARGHKEFEEHRFSRQIDIRLAWQLESEVKATNTRDSGGFRKAP